MGLSNTYAVAVLPEMGRPQKGENAVFLSNNAAMSDYYDVL